MTFVCPLSIKRVSVRFWYASRGAGLYQRANLLRDPYRSEQIPEEGFADSQSPPIDWCDTHYAGDGTVRMSRHAVAQCNRWRDTKTAESMVI